MIFFVIAALPSAASAVVVYDESIDGELSTDNLAPTDLGVFMIGTNSVTGQVTAIGDFFEGFNFTADVFTFEIAAGQQLDSMVLTSYATNPGSDAMFLSLDDGPTFQYSVNEINDIFVTPDVTQLMAARTIGNPHLGMDFLSGPDSLQEAGMMGMGSPFSVPLGPGQYSIYIQETGAFSDYSIAFNVSAAAVPEPSSACLMALAGLGFGTARRRRRKRHDRVAPACS